MVSTMPTREELKALIDALAEESLDQVERMLLYHLNPPKSQPEIEHLRQRNMQYRQAALASIRGSRKPGSMGLGGGSGFVSSQGGIPFSRQSFHHWDENTLIYQSLQAFDGQEVEMVERLSLSPDRKQLNCTLELKSGGRTLRLEDVFPAEVSNLEP